jgi:hypothetical protein
MATSDNILFRPARSRGAPVWFADLTPRVTGNQIAIDLVMQTTVSDVVRIRVVGPNGRLDLNGHTIDCDGEEDQWWAIQLAGHKHQQPRKLGSVQPHQQSTPWGLVRR